MMMRGSPRSITIMKEIFDKITNLFIYILNKTTTNNLIMLFWSLLIIYVCFKLLKMLIYGKRN